MSRIDTAPFGGGLWTASADRVLGSITRIYGVFSPVEGHGDVVLVRPA
jgi:hypothetical protein